MGRPAVKVILGERYGRLIVGARAPSVGLAAAWHAVCDCGVAVIVLGSRLLNGDTRSCGCLKTDAPNCKTRTHGKSKTRTYQTWLSMKERCYRPRSPSWPRYGAVGITICDRWRDSFENFLADMGERPPGMSIDRIDNDGNYEPGNCRWATAKEQARNTRQTKLKELDILEILGRVEHGESQASVSRRFGLRSCTVSAIVRGHLWAGVAA